MTERAGEGATSRLPPDPVPDLAEGARLVAELGINAGLPLWRALRAARARLRGSAPPGLEPDLRWRRHPLGAVPAWLAEALAQLAGELAAEAAAGGPAAACERLSAELERRGAHASAGLFRELRREAEWRKANG